MRDALQRHARLYRPIYAECGGLMALGTDGFGRSDTRERLRRFFEVDAASTVIATLYSLSQKGLVAKAVVEKAITELGVDAEKRSAL